MQKYTMRSGSYAFDVIAEGPKEAFREFFRHIYVDKVPLEIIGHAVSLVHNGEDYAMRTVPTLVNLNLMDIGSASMSLSGVLSVSTEEAFEIIKDCKKEDSWVAKDILAGA